MITIWKNSLRFDSNEFSQKFKLPAQAQIVHVALEGRPGLRAISFWSIVNTDNEIVEREFYIVGTGHPITGDFIYCGTTPVQPGLVFHLIERIGS